MKVKLKPLHQILIENPDHEFYPNAGILYLKNNKMIINPKQFHLFGGEVDTENFPSWNFHESFYEPEIQKDLKSEDSATESVSELKKISGTSDFFVHTD